MQGTTVHVDPAMTTAIVPIGDIQYNGNPDKVTSELRRHIELMESRPHTQVIYIGMGDYIDFASPSNRTRLMKADVYDTAQEVIDDAANRLTNEVASILAPTAGKWAGLLTGHHWYDFMDGTTSDTRLADLLKTGHLGSCAYVRLKYDYGNTQQSVIVWAHHGTGNGQSRTYGLRKLETQIQPRFEADIYLMGHTTGRGAMPVNYIKPVFYKDGFKLNHKEVWLVNTGGWAKAYEGGSSHRGKKQGDYAEQGMMPPAVLGAPVVYVVPKRSHDNQPFKIMVRA